MQLLQFRSGVCVHILQSYSRHSRAAAPAKSYSRLKPAVKSCHALKSLLRCTAYELLHMGSYHHDIF